MQRLAATNRHDGCSLGLAHTCVMLLLCLLLVPKPTVAADAAGGAYRAVSRIDGWTSKQFRIIQSLTLDRLASLPDSPGNRFADDANAARLGRALFFEPSLSGDGKMSCASCHQPERFFTDGQPRSGGANSRLGRNTPTTVGTGHQTWFYWDGRRDSLWSQALIPFEAPNEMASDRVTVLKRIAGNRELNDMFTGVFGHPPALPAAGPALIDGAGPLAAEPARSNWHHLGARDKRRINRSYARVGKSIEAYIRTQQFQPNLLDRYVRALRANTPNPGRMITQSQRLGLSLFIDDSRTQCLRCHNGARLSNDNFQNIGTGQFSGYTLDFGRIVGIQSLLADEFNCLGTYSDAQASECTAIRFMNRDPHQPLMGAFKTPSLRNVANTAPYFHDGRHNTLRAVIEHYRNPPAQNPARPHELQALSLSDTEAEALVHFLRMLSEAQIGTRAK